MTSVLTRTVLLGFLSVPLWVQAKGETVERVGTGSLLEMSAAEDSFCTHTDAYKARDPVNVSFLHLGDATVPAAPAKVGEDMRPSGVARIQVEIKGLANAKGMLVADGMSPIPVSVVVLDACERPIRGRLLAKVRAPGIRLAMPGSAMVHRTGSVAQSMGIDELEVLDGHAQFELISPAVTSDVPLSISVGKVEAKGLISFSPELRPLIASGLVEGVINLGRRTTLSPTGTAVMNDGFEQELRRFRREFGHGDLNMAGRAAVFIKGAIKGDVLLTASFDSEKIPRQRVMENINPEKYYPVMGDNSAKGLEAQSSDRLFVRLDDGRNYLLYGDFSTGPGFGQQLNGLSADHMKMRNLGQYNRSITGVRGYRQDERGFLDGFVMRDSLRQAVEEYRGNGTSGPYSVANLNAVENTEKIEIIARDKNNLSRIVSATALVRYFDYSFEPFNGRILLKSALPAFDELLNPISLRITYEVDTGGPNFWVYGVSGQRKVTDTLEIGGSYIKDENPTRPVAMASNYATVPGQGTMQMNELLSVNMGIETPDEGFLVLEMARSNSMTPAHDVQGNAYRFDWSRHGTWHTPWGQGVKLDARAFAGFSEKMFNNPASSYTGGRSEAGIRAIAQLSESTRLLLDALLTQDAWAATSRSALALRVEHRLDEKWTLDAGLRHLQQTEGAALSFSTASANLILPGQAPVFSGSGLNPAGAGFWGTGTGLNPVTGQVQSMLNGTLLPAGKTSPALDVWTVRAGLKYQYDSKWSWGLEIGQDMGMDRDPHWLAVNTQFNDKKWRLFARAETPTRRLLAGGDYKVTDDIYLYGRAEVTNGLSSSYALDSNTAGQTMVFGLRQSDNKGIENFNELRALHDFNGQRNENATGMRRVWPIYPGLKGQLSLERLKILNGQGYGANALTGGLEWTQDQWRASTRLEWRELDGTSAANGNSQSWMNTSTFAKKINPSWTMLARNYFLQTDIRNIEGIQIQNRFQIGMAYRPLDQNKFDTLFKYENKYQRNREISPKEMSKVDLFSLNLNYHPERAWWYMGHAAIKSGVQNLSALDDAYRAWLISGRILYDINEKMDIGFSMGYLTSTQYRSAQYAYGIESGYLLGKNIWLSLGYNFSGFYDKDLTVNDYTRGGAYLRLRIKFDEKSLHGF